MTLDKSLPCGQCKEASGWYTEDGSQSDFNLNQRTISHEPLHIVSVLQPNIKEERHCDSQKTVWIVKWQKLTRNSLSVQLNSAWRWERKNTYHCVISIKDTTEQCSTALYSCVALHKNCATLKYNTFNHFQFSPHAHTHHLNEQTHTDCMYLGRYGWHNLVTVHYLQSVTVPGGVGLADFSRNPTKLQYVHTVSISHANRIHSWLNRLTNTHFEWFWQCIDRCWVTDS